jgi:hypothetical protein
VPTTQLIDQNQCCGSGRIRIFLVESGSESGRLGPDTDPRLLNWLIISLCCVEKYYESSTNNKWLLTFRAYNF